MSRKIKSPIRQRKPEPPKEEYAIDGFYEVDGRIVANPEVRNLRDVLNDAKTRFESRDGNYRQLHENVIIMPMELAIILSS